MGHTSSSRGDKGTDLVGCVPSSGHSLSLRGLSPQDSTLFGGARSIAWCLRRPSLGECRRGLRDFWECRAHLGYGPASGPTLKKASCHTCPVVGMEDKYCWFNQLNLVNRTHLGRLWYQRHRPGRVCLISGHTLSLRGPSLQALTFFREVRFIAWHLRHLFLGKCWPGLRPFWECRVRLGDVPAPRPTLKKAWCHTRPYGRMEDNYHWFNQLNPVDGTHFGQPL